MIKNTGIAGYIFAAASFVLFFAVSASAALINSATFVTQTAPSKMIVGDKATVKVSFKNSGNGEWSADSGYMLKYVGSESSIWGVDDIKPISSKRVLQGGFIDFQFQITAPSKPGRYVLQWQVSDSEGNVFGQKSKAVSVMVEDDQMQSSFVSQLVSNTMEINKRYNITLQFKNIGVDIWEKGRGFALKPTSDRIAKTWAVSAVQLKQDVAPGEVATFTIPIRTPRQAGSYPFQWKLVQGNSFFGEASPWISIRVESGVSGHQAELVYSNVKQKMVSGKQYSVSVIMKNVGTTNWYSSFVSLDSRKPDRNLNWFINSVTLQRGEVVKPGEIRNFSFTVMAPLEPGVYPFKWQMSDKKTGWFGEATPELHIRVVAP